MSLEFQESAAETFAESKPFQKKPQDRTDEDLDLISRHIYDLKYFRDMVHKESGRLEFAKGCAKYLKYEYFPKGMEVLRKGDRGEHFYIILSGEAYVYIPKSEAEIQQEMNEDKQRVFEKYTEFLSQVDQPPNNNMLLSQLSQLPGATSRKSSVNGRSKSVAYSTQTTATIPAPAHFNFNVRKQESATKTLLAGNNKILKPEDMKYDLTYQEKLLFLNNKPVIPGYFDQGIATFKKVNCLRTGDSFGELALIFNQPRLASIIASEDLHLLSFTSYDYKEVFESEIQNVVEKIEFFNGIFPSLSSAHIGRFCYLLEEKTFKFNDIIYKEGDLADGIYIIRQGEVQLSQMTKQNAQDSPRAIGAKRGSITKRKIAAATLVTGNFFGDIETLNNCKRNYTAISVSTTFVYRLKKQAYHGIIAPHFPAIANFLKNQAESTEVTRQNRMEHTKKIQLLALPSFDRINPEPVQKLPEDIKENRMKGIATGRRKSEIFPLHFKARLDTVVLKEQDDEYVNHDLEKDLSIIPQAIEHVQLQSRPSLFDFKDSKVFALVSPREIIKPEQSILTPLSFPRRPSEISNCPSPWFPTPAKIPRLTISGCGSPENKTTNHGSSTAANTTSSRKFLPQLTKSRGSFSGLDIEKIADFGFSGLVNKLKRMPSVSQNNPSLPSSPKKHLTGGNSPTRQIINNMEEIPSMEHVDTPKENSPTTRKETDSPFNKTLAQLIKDKMEHKTTTSSPKTERVNFHVRTKMSKLPFKQMKSPSPDKSVPKTTRELAPLNISHGWKTDRTKNTDVTIMSGYKTEEKKLLQSPTFKKSVPVIDVAKIKRVEHDNVVKNEVLSARSVDARLRKTTHSMFRVFKQSIYK